MPYIRYKGKMFNVTSGEYVDSESAIYSFDRYTGTQFSDVTGLMNRNDIIWNGYLEGEAAINIGYVIEYTAKKYFYDNSVWPVLRILTSDQNDDNYIEWNHDSAMYLSIKANGVLQYRCIPFIWDDNIDVAGTPAVPRFNTVRARVFTTVSDAESLLLAPYYYGSFNPNDTTGGWFTRVTINKDIFSVTDPSYLFFNAGDYLGTLSAQRYPGSYRNRVTYKLEDGIGIFVCIITHQWFAMVGIWPCDSSGTVDSSYHSNFRMTGDYTGNSAMNETTIVNTRGDYFRYTSSSDWNILDFRYYQYTGDAPSYINDGVTLKADALRTFLDEFDYSIENASQVLYWYLTSTFIVEPPSDVDPEDIPPAYEPPAPIPPDSQDPYYDPESDPTSPTYDPIKDPTSPSYDPSVPATPYQPIIHQTILEYPAPIITPPDPIPAPETPATYVNTSRLFTIFTPTVSQLTDFANFLWASPTDIVPTFRKIVANPMDCVLGLMVIPQLSFTRQSRELNIGNIGTGITMDYAPSQFVDFDCGQLFLQEYYRSYLDYSPYTKVDIFLPFIGTRELSIDECMQKTIGVTYRFDLATGTCVAFIKVNGTVLYQFEGNCATHIPLSSADWGSTVKAVPTIAAGAIKAGGLIGGGPIGALGIAAAASVMSMKERHPHAGSLSGSAGLMGVLYPYLIVTRPCQALPESQNSFTGYPSFITLSLGECSGYTEVEQVHLEHVPATGEELIEIERLLKEGVLF